MYECENKKVPVVRLCFSTMFATWLKDQIYHYQVVSFCWMWISGAVNGEDELEVNVSVDDATDSDVSVSLSSSSSPPFSSSFSSFFSSFSLSSEVSLEEGEGESVEEETGGDTTSAGSGERGAPSESVDTEGSIITLTLLLESTDDCVTLVRLEVLVAVDDDDDDDDTGVASFSFVCLSFSWSLSSPSSCASEESSSSEEASESDEEEEGEGEDGDTWGGGGEDAWVDASPDDESAGEGEVVDGYTETDEAVSTVVSNDCLDVEDTSLSLSISDDSVDCFDDWSVDEGGSSGVEVVNDTPGIILDVRVLVSSSWLDWVGDTVEDETCVPSTLAGDTDK